ncbi:MAG: autotransporter-associated beta strand repeat-containing protein, partial [Verrucomicrobiota bacterium]
MKFNNPSNRTQRSFSALAQALAVLVLAPAVARAATISKADNTDNLNLTTSWTGSAVPGTADIAQWTNTVTAANTTASLGADLSWAGIKIVGPGAAVTINPGNTLTVGASGIDLSAATKDLTLNCGLALRNTGQHSWKAASGRSLNVAGTLSRAGTVVDFNSFNAAATLNGLANDASGILGPWATTGTGTGNTLNYVKSTAGAISAFTGQTPATSPTDLSNVTDVNVNYSLASTTGGVTLTGSIAANTLRVTSTTTGGTGDATTLTVNTPNSITLNGLIGVGTGRTAISGTGNLVIGTSRELVVNWTVGQNRMYCPIVDNPGGSSSVTLNNRGGGEQWYATDGAVGTINTYTGGTVINATTAFTLDCWQTSFGSGPITVNGNGVAINVYYRHAAVVSNSITVNSAGGYLRTIGGTFAGPITLNASTITMSNISGNISGVGGVNHNLTGTCTFSGINTYTGPTTVTTGTLKAGRASVPNFSGAFGLNSAVTMANAAAAILDLNGYNIQIGSLTGGGPIGGTVTNSSAVTAATLTVGGNNTSTAYAGLVSGSKLSLCKIGSGTLTLSGANSYGGNTALSAGSLSLSPTAAGGYLVDGGDVYLTTGAVLNLSTGGTTTDIIRSLYIDGVPQATGVWGADGSGAEHTSTLITGSGKLSVTTFGAATSYSISGTVTENGVALAGVSVTDGT